MLQRLRRKIVAIVMAISGVVLLLSAVAMLAMSYTNSYAQISDSMRVSAERGPVIEMTFTVGRQAPQTLDGPGSDERADDDGPLPDGRDKGRGQRPGAMGMTPCAVFLVDSEGAVLEDNGSFVEMDAQTAATALSTAATASDDEGYIGDADVFYHREVYSDGTLVVAFADALPLRNELLQLARNMAIVGAIVLAALFAASTLLARIATRPVERAWDQQRQFVADASHELKTPLTVILANSGILADDPALTPDQAKWVGSTQDEASHMKGLIEEMLTLAQSDEAADGGKRVFSDIDLSDVVMRSCLAFDAVAFEAGVTIVDDVDAGVHISGDVAQIERLVKILVDNAVKYAGEGGRAEVRLASVKDRARLAVSNSGPAIPPEEIPHVFDRFWRGDGAHTRSSRGSYGLGLAIAKSIADAHGAQIGVASDEASGTTFWVSFPAARGD